MSQFIPGDLVSTKSGILYRVADAAAKREGKVFVRAVTQVRGSGWRWLSASGLKMVTPAERPTRTELREAAIQEAQQEDASLAAQREAVADLYGPTVTEPAADPEAPRVLSPMDRDRQVRRMAAEIRGVQPEQRWDALTLAAALYDAGFRATDPGSPIQ